MSLASTTQLYNPATRDWSEKLVAGLKLPPKLLPPIVPAGTKLGPPRPEVVKETRLEGTEVIASCSHELAAALVALPVSRGENSVFLRSGPTALMGTELSGRLLATRAATQISVTQQRSVVPFFARNKSWVCGSSKSANDSGRKKTASWMTKFLNTWPLRRRRSNRSIKPDDARFLTPEDMPLKIQAFCKETNQPVPRKPGPIIRCVLESLALLFRMTLSEFGEFDRPTVRPALPLRRFSKPIRRYHFTANALEIPVVLAPPNAAAVGNVLVQALAQGHIESIDEARDIVRNSFKLETITPHPAVRT